MIEFPPRQWLGAVPWDSVQALNQALCQAQKFEYGANLPAFDQVRIRWEQASAKASGLVEALEVLHDCREALPFTYNNGNTFAAIAKTLVDEWLAAMPPLEAQILRTTICHYVAGQVGRKELIQVLKHFSPACQRAAPAKSQRESAQVPGIEPQAAV